MNRNKGKKRGYSMKRIWKDVIIALCYISIFFLLIYQHYQVLYFGYIKEIPYVLLMLLAIIIILWLVDKMKLYQSHMQLEKRLQGLCNQYALEEHNEKGTISFGEDVLDQMNLLLKQSELQLFEFENRYRFIAELSDQVIFEYNLRSHTICDSTNWNLIASGERFVNHTIERGIIHPEDADQFRNFFYGFHTSNEILDIKIRMCDSLDDNYHWITMKGIILAGIDGKPEKIIGRKTNIDNTAT